MHTSAKFEGRAKTVISILAGPILAIFFVIQELLAISCNITNMPTDLEVVTEKKRRCISLGANSVIGKSGLHHLLRK